MSTTTVITEAGTVPGYLAVPSGQGPWPGVVVIHQAFGLDDDIRAITDRFAAEGYAFYALDLRKHGRSLLPHQHPCFCKDLAEYHEDLTRALEEIGSATLRADIASMKHETQYTRLFRS